MNELHNDRPADPPSVESLVFGGDTDKAVEAIEAYFGPAVYEEETFRRLMRNLRLSYRVKRRLEERRRHPQVGVAMRLSGEYPVQTEGVERFFKMLEKLDNTS